MKKLSVLFAMFLLVASFGMAYAELEWEDPALCVAGQWLLIDAAYPTAVKVFVPRGTAYGDQAAGGCTTPAPAPLLPASAVKAFGGGDKMTVLVNSDGASPVVVVSYAGDSETRRNHGRWMMFRFDLDD